MTVDAFFAAKINYKCLIRIVFKFSLFFSAQVYFELRTLYDNETIVDVIANKTTCELYCIKTE